MVRRTYMVTVVWATRGIDIFFLDTATQQLLVYTNCLVCVCPSVRVSMCQCVRVCVQTLIAHRPKVARSPNFAYPQNRPTGICRYLDRNSTTLPSGGNVLRHASVAISVSSCEVQLFFGASPRPKVRWKALD